MIKITHRDMNSFVARHYQEVYLDNGLDDNLKQLFEAESGDVRRFYKRLYDNRKGIITGKPNRLNTLLTKLRTDFPVLMDCLTNLSEHKKEVKKATGTRKTDLQRMIVTGKKLQSDLQSVFPYKGHFANKKTRSKWNAYTMAEMLGIAVCPYCNRNYTTTYRRTSRGRGSTRPQFDHFFNQARYPFFALSFYNLVPSCSVCNSNMKGDQDLSYDLYLNPYEYGFEDHLLFFATFTGTKSQLRTSWFKDPKFIKIELVPNLAKTSPSDIALIDKARNQDQLFHLERLYDLTHRDVAAEMYAKADEYNSAYLAALSKAFPQVYPTPQDAARMLLGNYVKPQEFHKRSLAKFTRDIARDLKLI